MREKILRDKEMRRRKAAEDIKSKDEVNLPSTSIELIDCMTFEFSFSLTFQILSVTGEKIGRRDSTEIEANHCHRKENYFTQKKVGHTRAVDNRKHIIEGNQIVSNRSKNTDRNRFA